ncbi:MAG: hypothetical protein PHI05_00280 [Bacilli bacterium]|nr:hypothetical protein [Bacilli bacterium]MDD4547176.1 hypothetical protein [Bacilli bacterium]
MKKEKINLLDLNMLTSSVFIITITVSIILMYNEKLILLGKKPIFNKNDVKNIENTNRFILLIVVVVFVYIEYRRYKLSEIFESINNQNSSFIKLVVSEIQLIIVIVLIILPIIYPETEQQYFEDIII